MTYFWELIYKSDIKENIEKFQICYKDLKICTDIRIV